MLDSFPLIKFGHVEGSSSSAPAPPKAVDLERDGAYANLEDDANPHISVDESATTSDVKDREQRRSGALSSTFAPHEVDIAEGSHPDMNDPSHPDNHNPDEETEKTSGLIDPESIGRETCPICIIDFEHGDDLRVLPCEGKHRFHQHCVDPWLLQLSTSCPICRADFNALETMAEGNPPSDVIPEPSSSDTAPGASQRRSAARFSRYLRFAERRRNREMSTQTRNRFDMDIPLNPNIPMEHTDI